MTQYTRGHRLDRARYLKASPPWATTTSSSTRRSRLARVATAAKCSPTAALGPPGNPNVSSTSTPFSPSKRLTSRCPLSRPPNSSTRARAKTWAPRPSPVGMTCRTWGRAARVGMQGTPWSDPMTLGILLFVLHRGQVGSEFIYVSSECRHYVAWSSPMPGEAGGMSVWVEETTLGWRRKTCARP